MPVMPTPQQSDWTSNVYVLATTRIFIVIGLAYLIKSLYTLVPAIWGTRSASVAAAVADGIELASIVSDIPGMVPGAADLGPDLEANLTLDLRRPQPTYDPHHHTERAWANSPIQRRSAEVSGQSAVVQTVAEQDVVPHIEEDIDITVGYARQETMVGSAVDEEMCEPATPPAGDTILPSPDA